MRDSRRDFDPTIGEPDDDYDPTDDDGPMILLPPGGFDHLASRDQARPETYYRGGLRILTSQECASSPARGYVIKHLLAPRDIAVVFGHPGAGKSVLCPYLGYAVAQGRPVFGSRVKKGKVLYVAAEDPHGMKPRVSALRQHFGDTPDFLLVDGVADLFSEESSDRADIIEVVEVHRPALVIIDTIAAAFPGLRENEGQDMGLVIAFCRRLTELGAAVILAHHPPKGDDSTPRGHGALNGAADVALRLGRHRESVQVISTKNRNGPSNFQRSFRIGTQNVGIDEDGEAITAPVLQEQEGELGSRTTINPAEEKALACLRDLLRAEGQQISSVDEEPSELIGVSERRWREKCTSIGISNAKSPESRGRVVRRAMQSLISKGLVRSGAGFVWTSDLSG